jgi:hypothetical protein
MEPIVFFLSPGFSWQKVSIFFASWQRLKALPCKAFKKEKKTN